MIFTKLSAETIKSGTLYKILSYNVEVFSAIIVESGFKKKSMVCNNSIASSADITFLLFHC